MDDIRKVVKEKVNIVIAELGNEISVHNVKPLSTVFFVVFNNEEIKMLTSDDFLIDNDYKMAIIFPRISYLPDTQRTETFLKAVTVNKNKEVQVGAIDLKSWRWSFYNQDLRRQSLPLEIRIENHEIDIDKRIYQIGQDNFPLHLRMLNSVLSCTKKNEAEFILSFYDKEKEIDELFNKIRLQNRKLDK